MNSVIAATNAMVAIHEDRIQQAEERILEALSTLTRHHVKGDSSIAASLTAMISPSTQVLVWD